jgi:23S rRNA (cytosine1962-C5)-methyltransferase
VARRGEDLVTLAGLAGPAEVEIREHGLRFGVDLQHGQKTGFFLDHRENRRAVGGLSKGLRVMNVFSYTGGFTVAAAAGGARELLSIDSAGPALRECQANLERNGLGSIPHDALKADAFAALEELGRKGRSADLVVLDPPSFAPSEKALERALAAYRDLVRLGLGVLAPGGLLLVASCSSHVDEPHFLEAVREGAAAARRVLRVLRVSGAGADHPWLLPAPEGRYLKAVLAVAS